MKNNLKEIVQELDSRPKFDAAYLNITEEQWRDFYIKLGFWYERLERKVIGLEKELRERYMHKEKVSELLKEPEERKDWKRFAEILIAAAMSNRISIAELLGDDKP